MRLHASAEMVPEFTVSLKEKEPRDFGEFGEFGSRRSSLSRGSNLTSNPPKSIRPGPNWEDCIQLRRMRTHAKPQSSLKTGMAVRGDGRNHSGNQYSTAITVGASQGRYLSFRRPARGGGGSTIWFDLSNSLGNENRKAR